ncbi:MAG: xanthine dehydrogenase family protein molybdopterin-binding subunit [Dehalococcoidia bacterium]|nr:xanthine dehydrogenase family protein molybdopterin-binding subunit [Dehalococcoidia bacterium]MDW8119086.1 xanthine dehydrogenase family protein molybdopterin-binding subunit [Chloroflexota bacterium]
MVISKMVGARIKRKEDPRLITGKGTYTDDVRLPGTLYMAVLRSPHAHARIRKLDVSKALGHPGVVAVLTGAEVKQMCGPLPAQGPLEGMKLALRYPLAVNKVTHVGEGVAAVVAESRYLARDALDLIEVDYEPLPAVVDPEQGMKRTAPVIHEHLKTNLAYSIKQSVGDVEGAFRQAAGTVKARWVEQRLIPLAMECRAVVAHYEPGPGTLTIWNTTQNPHILRGVLAGMLRLAENRIRVIAPDVGGGFGSKIDVYPEEALAALFSLRLGRPVQWAEERTENFVATIHGRGQLQEVEAAYDAEGHILALRVRIWADLGAYCQLFTHAIPTLTLTMLNGTYRFANAAWELYGVYTNKTPTDAYRGAGRPEATYLLERTMDLVAHRLGLDPAEVRRRNFIPKEVFPYQTAVGTVYDSGDYEGALDKVLALANYKHLRQEQQERLKRGDRQLLGIGFSTFVEICGFAPNMPENATVRVEPSGAVTVFTGTSPHGQGEETTFAQIVAEELGVPIDDITVVHGDTLAIPHGNGTLGSRTLALGGTAVLQAARQVKEKARTLAAHLLKMPPDKVSVAGGHFFVEDIPDKKISWKEVAEKAYTPPPDLPAEWEPGLVATSYFKPPNFTFPFGAHIAVVEVDRETGDVRLRDYFAVDDCGHRINPLLVEGQLHGGLAQGIAQALYEEVIYDENGQLLTNNLMNYAAPNAAMLPSFTLEAMVTPTPTNPLGAKGVGELGTIGATPAVVNAVADALRHIGVDPAQVQMPTTPERVWRLIRQAERRRR